MSTHKAKITQDELQRIAHIEASIQHWGAEHTQLMLKASKALQTIDSLYSARQQILDKSYKEAGIDTLTVQHVNIDAEGVVTVVCLDPPPPPVPSSATVTDPAPPMQDSTSS